MRRVRITKERLFKKRKRGRAFGNQETGDRTAEKH
jgi:hypothetical protein